LLIAAGSGDFLFAAATFAFDRQPGVEPVLLPFLVLADVAITHSRQFTGGVLGGMSSNSAAVGDDLGGLVGQERGREFLDTVVGNVDGAR
jgi:hypothetical protein